MLVVHPARASQARRGSASLSLTVGIYAILALTTACNSDNTAPRTPATLFGAQVAIGNGTARTFVAPGASGQPTSIGIELSSTALDGLPGSLTEWALPLPAGGTAPPWNHVVIDWNPQGHPPTAIYGVPHFDFHFYDISPTDQMSIAGGPDTTTVPPADVPSDYASQVMSVPMMGVHWTDTLAAEFHGQPFDKTFIYGFYQGKMVFVEPMVTRDLLTSHPDVSAPVKQPEVFQQAGLYPRSYGVHYDASSQTIRITLDSLVEHPAG